MRVRVLFFGRLKDIVGRAEDTTDLPAGARVEDLLAAYGAQHPELVRFRGSMVASVNQVFAMWNQPLCDGDEVAFLPPVSGGEPPSDLQACEEICEITLQPINLPEIVARLKSPRDGALVVFEGIVRNHSGGRETLYLDYEGYEPMALVKMREIAVLMRTQFPVDRVALIHRLGRLQIGETSVLIAVSSAHRGVAFDACRLGIDTLKKIVPIWKKEYFADGAVWAEGELPPLPSKIEAPESKA